MQGHRSIVGSSTGAIEFDHGAAPSSAAISTDLFWSDHSLPELLPSSGSTGMSHFGSNGYVRHNLSLWSQGEGSSSSMQNDAGISEQLENGCPSGSLDRDTVTGFEERFNMPTYLSQDNSIPNLGSSHTVNRDRPLTPRGSNSVVIHQSQLTSNVNASHQNLNLNVRVSEQAGDHIQFCESHNSYRSGFSGSGQRPVSAATHSNITPGHGSHLMGEDNGSHDACRLHLKRKIIDEDIGQSSASESVRSSHHAEGSSWHPISIDNSDNDSNFVESHTPVYNISPGGIFSGSMPDVSQVENGRNSERNLRLRLSSAAQDSAPVHIGSAGSAFTPNIDSGLQHPETTFPTTISFTPEVANHQTHPTSAHVPVPRNGQSFRRSRGSNSRSNSSGVVIGERSSVPNAEATLRMSRLMLERRMRAHQMIQVSQRHLSATRGSGSTSAMNISVDPNPSLIAAAAVNSEPDSHANMVAGRTWGPGHNFASGERIAEIIRSSVVAAGGSDHARSNNNQSPSMTGGASSRQPISASGINSQGNQIAQRRLQLLMQRRGNSMPGVPYSLQSLNAAGDDRSQLLSEIWSALDSMRRGEPLRPEDMMILDQSGLFGMAAELHDRHRDMRLDVDNMSYEELLALEERIGNVNTGLTEEAVKKCLKQHKFVAPTAMATPSDEVTEPCCICQEEYNEGEDLGILDCGHNFHTDCVKQWLMVKNLCPICKTTGLASQ